jgi:hypothetical protein
MKKAILVLFLITSCDEEKSGGCLTAIPKNGTDRVFIKCLTRDEFNRGEHETSSWTAYKGHKFEQCDNCE